MNNFFGVIESVGKQFNRDKLWHSKKTRIHHLKKSKTTFMKKSILISVLIFSLMIAGCVNNVGLLGSISVKTTTVDDKVAITIDSTDIISVKGSDGATYTFDEIKGRITNTRDLPVTAIGGCARLDNRGQQMFYDPTLRSGIIAANGGVSLFTMDIPLSQLSDNNALITCSIKDVFIQYPTPIPTPTPLWTTLSNNLIKTSCTGWGCT